MITSVRLDHWRAYDSLELPLGPGTTFLVARNGVGKSSVLEAVSWALFGSALTGIDAGASRRGERDASVTLTLDWPGQEGVRITRTVGTGSARTRKPREALEFEAGRVTGADDEQWLELLGEAWGAAPGLLARLLHLSEQAVWSEAQRPVSTDVTAGVRQVLGLDTLEALAASAGKQARASERVAKETVAVSADEVEAARARATELATAHTTADERVQLLRETYVRRQTGRRHAAAVAAWEQRRTAAAAQALQTARTVLTSRPERDDVAGLVSAVESALLDTSAKVAEQRALLELTRRHSADLTADDDCPVCLRPMDAAAVEGARRGHADQLARLQGDVTTHEAALAALRAAHDTLVTLRDGIGPEPVAPDGMPEPGDDPRPDDELVRAGQEAAKAAEELRDQLGAARERSASLDARNRAFQQSARAFRRQALALVVQQTARQTADGLTTSAVEPLADLVRSQWRKLPLGRSLDLDDAGALTARRADRDLGYASLSGGEKAQALLLYRVAALKALTRSPLFVLDEPLEHLDPRNRWLVGRMICGLTPAGAFGQTLVATYEDALARRLARGSDDARVVHLPVGTPRP